MKTFILFTQRSPFSALRLMLGPILAGTALFTMAGLHGLRAQSSEFVSGTSWNSASDWNPSGVPGSTSTVVMDSGSPGGSYTMNANLQIGNITFSTSASTGLTNAASSTVSLTLLGQGAGVPLIELNSTAGLTITNLATGTLGLILGGTNNAIDSENSGTMTIGANVSGTGGLTFTNTTGSGSAVVTLSGTNTFTGGLAVTGHGVEVDVTTGDAGLGAAGGSVTINGGRLGFATTSTTISSARTLFVGSNPGGVNTNGTISIKGGSTTVTYDGIIQDVAGSTGDLVKQGSGTLALGGANAYTGGTYLNNGVTRLFAANALPTTTSVSIGQAASSNTGTLDLNGNNAQIDGLNSVTGSAVSATNTVTSTAAATLTLSEGGGQSFSYGSNTANNSGIITGAVSVVLTGSGTQVLGGVNTYTGTTTVNGGVLAVNGSTATASAVTVNSTGTLAGTGTVKGAVAVNSGGAISPGTAGTGGVLTLGGNLTLSGGSALDFQLATTAQGEMVLTGTGITLAGPLTGKVAVDLFDINGTEAPGTYTLVSVTNTPASTVNWGLSDFTLGAPAEWSGSFLSLGTDGTDLDVTIVGSAIPEPATYAGIFGVLVLTVAAWIRRPQSSLTPKATS